MRRTGPLLFLLLFLAAGCQGGQERALAEVKRLGGKVARDGGRPDGPVVLLDFSFTSATDADLACATAFPQLRELYVWNTGITDAGLERLAGLTDLQKLDLSGTAVTDAGLAPLRGLTRLQELNLKSTRVTDAGVKGLRKHLPKTRILR